MLHLCKNASQDFRVTRLLYTFVLTYNTSVTTLGGFWKILATNFASKVAQKFDDFWGFLKNFTLFLKYNEATFSTLEIGLLLVLISGRTDYHRIQEKLHLKTIMMYVI